MNNLFIQYDINILHSYFLVTVKIANVPIKSIKTSVYSSKKLRYLALTNQHINDSKLALTSLTCTLRLVESSEWLVQLSSLLQRSGAVVDLTDLLGASVMLLLEDGWDFTAQVLMRPMLPAHTHRDQGWK